MTEKTFLGYERPNGYAGARNYVLIMPINRSLNFIASNVAKMTRGTRHFEIPAETGRPAKDRETIARTMAGLMNNPNVGCILLMAVKPSSSSAYRNMSDVRFIEEAKKTGKPWRIGLQRPDRERGSYFAVVLAEDESVITSGAYERNFTKNGKRYGHILSARTGRPVDTDLASVSIIDRDGARADALCTAFFAMGWERSSAFLKAHPDVKAVLLSKDLKRCAVSAALADRITLADKTITLETIGVAP